MTAMAFVPISARARARREYWSLLLTEALVGAAVSLLLGGAVAWLGYHKLVSVPVWGVGGLVADMVPSTLVPALLMVLTLPLVVARRLAGSRLAALVAAAPPAWPHALAHRPLRRALTLVNAATGIAVVATAVPMQLAGAEYIAPIVLVAIKFVQNSVLGLVLAPLIVAHMLADRRQQAAKVT